MSPHTSHLVSWLLLLLQSQPSKHLLTAWKSLLIQTLDIVYFHSFLGSIFPDPPLQVGECLSPDILKRDVPEIIAVCGRIKPPYLIHCSKSLHGLLNRVIGIKASAGERVSFCPRFALRSACQGVIHPPTPASSVPHPADFPFKMSSSRPTSLLTTSNASASTLFGEPSSSTSRPEALDSTDTLINPPPTIHFVFDQNSVINATIYARSGPRYRVETNRAVTRTELCDLTQQRVVATIKRRELFPDVVIFAHRNQGKGIRLKKWLQKQQTAVGRRCVRRCGLAVG